MKKIVFLLISCLIAPLAWAQIQVTAQVDKTNITLDDEVTLIVTVRGGRNIEPQLPSLPSFNVYSQLRSSSYINGQTLHEFRYIMMPRMVGNATIGAITVDYQGKTYRTDPIEIHVYRPSDQSAAQPATSTASAPAVAAAPTTGNETANNTLPPLEQNLINQAQQRGQKEPFFIVSAVSNTHPYVGQGFTLAIRFYYAERFSNTTPYQNPTISNLFMEGPTQTEGTQTINGRQFYYYDWRYQLTGAAPGEAVIGATRLELAMSSFDWFGSFFFNTGSSSAQPRTVESAPIRLMINRLPADNPASFYGAVGAGFILSATADRTQVEAGESINLSLTVAGPASLKSTKNFNFPEIPGFKSYPVAPVFKSGKRSTKTFKTVLVANASGIYTVPSLEWSYFDPVTQQYKTLQSNPISITVTPSSTQNRSVNFAAQLPTAGGVETLGTDINYLKTTPAPQETILVRLSRLVSVNWACVALLLLGLFLCVGRKQDRAKQAYGEAKALLAKATSYEQIAEALSHYLALRLSIHTGSLPIKDIVSALRARGYQPAQTEPFAALWQQLETLRFAPAESTSSSVKQQAQAAREVLQLLEGKAK